MRLLVEKYRNRAEPGGTIVLIRTFNPGKRESNGEIMTDGKIVEVSAIWDDEAGVWVVESEDVPGLVTEAETMEALKEKNR